MKPSKLAGEEFEYEQSCETQRNTHYVCLNHGIPPFSGIQFGDAELKEGYVLQMQ